MSNNRIQKLLFSEYCEFEDMVLLESPFAQTFRDGKGIRQVHLGLTPSKLILATDVIPSAKSSSVMFHHGLDPEIETFELIAVYPVESVNLSIFHRRRRQSLKARFCNNRVLYFELGGFEKRNMFWNLWCERVKFLNPDDPGSSNSETSVSTSTSNSTLYLINTKAALNKYGKPQLWCNYDTRRSSRMHFWNDKNLYMGKGFEDDDRFDYAKKATAPISLNDFIPTKADQPNQNKKTNLSKGHASKLKLTKSGHYYSVNRFGEGVYEKCETSLFLPAENFIVPKQFSNTSTTSTDAFTLYPIPPPLVINIDETAENSVRLWELSVEGTKNCRSRHRRRYALSPQPHFLYGLGPWNISSGERFSLQMKRAVSVVSVRRQPAEPELRLPVSKRYLLASISTENLNLDISKKTPSSTSLKPKCPIVYFWTPNYWYHPRSSKDAYKELQKHLQTIRKHHQQLLNKRKKKRSNLFHKKKLKYEVTFTSQTDESIESLDDLNRALPQNPNCFTDTRAILACFCLPREVQSPRIEYENESSKQYLKRILRMEITLTAWDFNSTTLAHQLTMIDRDLFLKISTTELAMLIWQNSSKNAPNVGAMIAFSHRISCLIATEILRNDTEKVRARIITRFINSADKCNKISNFHTCKSILSGLQSPAIYRLHSTWNYVRRKHSSKYQLFEELCKIYRDPRMPAYQEMFSKTSINSPCLPYIGDIIVKLLDKLPKQVAYKVTKVKEKGDCNEAKLNPTPKDEKSLSSSIKPSILRKFLYKLKVATNSTVRSHQPEKEIKQKNEFIKNENEKHDADIIFNESDTNDLELNQCLIKYEDNRPLCLKEALDLLEKIQSRALQYTYARNELAREYLLKARYKEEKENFINSFSVEINNLL